MRLGVFGGTFDPIHFGHLLLAESCREQCRLDQVWFLPAARPPHKQQRALTDARRRIEMLELAVGGHDDFVVSRLEIERGGVSYTVDSLEAIRQLHPLAELFLLMGADSLQDLPTWHLPQRICELALPVVVGRVAAPEPDFSALGGIVTPQRLEEIRHHRVHMPLVELSSTDLRERAAEGRSLRFRTPRGVEMYILTNQLYRDDTGNDTV